MGTPVGGTRWRSPWPSATRGEAVAAAAAAKGPGLRERLKERRKQQRAASASMADEELQARLKVDERLDGRRGDGSPSERDGRAGGTSKSARRRRASRGSLSRWIDHGRHLFAIVGRVVVRGGRESLPK